jgi:hypothetical protein
MAAAARLEMATRRNGILDIETFSWGVDEG